MRRIEQACMALGAVLIVGCAAVVYWPASLGVAGAMLVAAGWPKGTS
jgi:hypothetical protein